MRHRSRRILDNSFWRRRYNTLELVEFSMFFRPCTNLNRFHWFYSINWFSAEKCNPLILEHTTELDAHLPRFDSTHKYFETSKYEHLTPSELWVLEIVDFEVEISSNPLVKYNGEATNILIEIRTTSESPSFVIPKSYPKPCQICGPAGREILDFNFYRNRSNSDTSPHPKTRDENDQKMSPNQWFCVMPYRSQSCGD